MLKTITAKTRAALTLAIFALCKGLFAQTPFPEGSYWSLDAGFGMTDILVKGLSYQFVVDPKIWLSPPLMIGARAGVNYSTDNILTFENQAYLRWNFLRAGPPEKKLRVFAQGGLGLLASYREDGGLFSDPTKTRGSFMLDTAAGATIPLSAAWHIEPAVHGGYPHIAGFSLTVGRKFPFPRERGAPQPAPEQEARPSTVELIMFGPDTGLYNEDVDLGARKLNDLILNETAEKLAKNPGYRVRIEGHANPVLNNSGENARLMALSRARAEAVAAQLRERGVREKQMVIAACGGDRPVTGDHSLWDRNRRVELTVFQAPAGQREQ